MCVCVGGGGGVGEMCGGRVVQVTFLCCVCVWGGVCAGEMCGGGLCM